MTIEQSRIDLNHGISPISASDLCHFLANKKVSLLLTFQYHPKLKIL